MKTQRIVGSYDAKTHLPRLLERVAGGETITITKRGRPVAVLSPVEDTDRESLDNVVIKIKELRKQFTLGKIDLKKLIHAGRE